MTADPRAPVLCGWGVATQREDDFRRAQEPLGLMLEAVRAAGEDSGSPRALGSVDWIAVPKGRWSYANPAGAIGESIGATQATTVLASVGVLQQSLIGEACARIARGESRATLVAGGDAGHRLLRAQIAGERAFESQQEDAPHEHWTPAEELRHPVEKALGLSMPVGLYALIESAWRHARGWSVDDHRDRLARLYERMSAIAAENPHAWQRTIVPASAIREPGPKNPMQAFPYTRSHCSSWNVDQAAALLFCSSAHADALGVPMERRIHPLASAESNHMVPVIERAALDACPGASIAGRAALAASGIDAADVDLIELYSCFPVAVELYAEALGLSLERPLTVTGGMPFAGGPYNNYVLQATCRAAELLREMAAGAASRGGPSDDSGAAAHRRARRTALVGSVSGIVTKQGFGLWSTVPSSSGFVNADVTPDVAKATGRREAVTQHEGAARVAACTVLHAKGEAPRAIVMVDTPEGRRAMASSVDASLVAAVEREERVGTSVRIEGQRWVA